MGKKMLENNILKIKPENLKAGMKLAKDIDYKFGSVFLPQNTILDTHKIKRLCQMPEVDEVNVYDEKENELRENLDEVRDIELEYQSTRDKTKLIFERFKYGNKIKYGEINNLTDDITSLGNEQEMMTLLTKVREVDQYTYNHLINVGMFSYMFGSWLGLSEEKNKKLAQAGLLHDIGKAHIPDKILNKPGKLTKKEYEKMKKHTIYGYNMSREFQQISEAVSQGILTHHERYDGSGYPLGLKGKKIPLFGRILGIVDTFDAMTAERVYKPCSSPFKVVKLFIEKDIRAFDYQLVNVFLDRLPNYFVNKKVELEDGREGTIVFVNPQKPDKPVLKVGNEYIDLFKNNEVEIKRIIDKI